MSEGSHVPERQSALEEAADAFDRRLLESTTAHAIFLLDDEGHVTSWSGPATTLYGHEAESILGDSVRVLLTDEESEDADTPLGNFFQEPATGPSEFEQWHQRADGDVFWGTLTLSPLSDDGTGYVAVSQDTTAAREYEQMLERQNDRLKEFTDVLAHDLRNPLNVIDGRLALYEDTGDEAHLEAIHETTTRMERLVEDLLRVARQGAAVANPEPTDIGTVIETAWEGTGGPANANLNYEAVPTVSADSDRLVELFENLFRNAVEHSSTSNRPAPDDAVEHGGANVTVSVGPLVNGFYVEDNGPGISDEQKDDVFDHGFTTAPGGSGYGLSVVRTIGNAHGWDVAVADAPGGGARFEITGVDFRY